MLSKLLCLTLIITCSLCFHKITHNIIENNIWPEENYHGYIPIDESKKEEIFYWWFPSRRSREKDPLILWMTGGPGCSSELALFVENGPFKVNEMTLEVETNKWAWNNEANLLYIDQPAGTGFSKIDPKEYLTTEEQVEKAVYAFLVGFLEQFPEFKGRDFYLTGESYAGHYVPHVSNYVFNQRNPDLPLKGLAIGNGWYNPWVQNEAYLDYALMNKLINFNDYVTMMPKFRECETMMQYKIKGGNEQCNDLTSQIQNNNLRGWVFNQYDITKPCPDGGLCYNFTYLTNFMNSKRVKTDLGVDEKITWESCNGPVGEALGKNDERTNAAPKLEDTLNAGLKVWIYHGDLDFICNWIGGEKAIGDIDWYGRNEFVKTKYVNAGYGLKKQYKNLRFIKFSNSGHMVPLDQPENAFKMLKEFVDLDQKWEFDM